jgi:hypothetical protein
MTTLDATDSAGLVLRVRFTRERDRYAHAILAVEPCGREHLLLESVEGTPDDEFPRSPPLQSLSIEELAPGRRAALLVGMAGGSHWSASIEAVPGHAALIFDVACRVSAGRKTPDPLALASTYAQHHADSWRARVIPQNVVPGATLVARRAERIAIEPAPVTITTPTVRWRYAIELSA